MDQLRANTPAPIKANLMTELLSVQMSWGNVGCTRAGSPGDQQTREFGPWDAQALSGDDVGERVGPWWVKHLQYRISWVKASPLTNDITSWSTRHMPPVARKIFQKLETATGSTCDTWRKRGTFGDSPNGHLHASHLHHVAHKGSNPVLEGLLYVLPPTRSQCMYRLSTKSHLGENGTLMRVLLHPLNTVSSFGPPSSRASDSRSTIRSMHWPEGHRYVIVWPLKAECKAKPAFAAMAIQLGQDHPVVACGQGPVTPDDGGALTGQRRPLVFTIIILASALPILVSGGQVTLAQQDVGEGEAG